LEYGIKLFFFILIWSIQVHTHFLIMFSESLPNNYKNSDFYIIFHNAFITANLFEILQMLPRICFAYRMTCFSSILVWVIQIHQHFRQCSVEFCQTIEKTVICTVLSMIALSLPTKVEALQMLPKMCVTYRIKCFPLF